MGCSVGKAVQVVTVNRPAQRSSADNTVRTREAGSASSPAFNAADVITLVHFNDVYNVEEHEREPVGGAARFKTQVDSLQYLSPLVLFSGDALNPSNMSTVTQGEQMVPVLNSLRVQAAVYGNHDFDFGVEHLVSIAGRTSFPWLMSNVRDRKTGRLLAEGGEKLIIEWQGRKVIHDYILSSSSISSGHLALYYRKVGLVGLVEREWLVTLATVDPEEVEYTDFVVAAKTLLPQLKQEGCDLLVALTHMRMPNDVRLAEEVPEFHLVLGGHDHHYERREVGDTLVLKSGSDFREFSQITVTFRSEHPSIAVTRHKVTRDVPPEPGLQAVVNQYTAMVEDGMQVEIGRIECALEGRFSYIRTQETNLGNLVCDIMCRATRADVALLNSGTLRSDTLHEPGVFKMKDLTAILPMVDALTVLKVTGEQLLAALENGVSQYPRHEGRFPQVSGLAFSFDPSQPGGSRVVLDSVRVRGEPLQMNRTYRLCTKGYLASGKDGYDVFRAAKVVLSHEEGPILSSIVRNHFHNCSRQQNGGEFTDNKTASTITLGGSEGSSIHPQVEGRIVNISNG